MPGQPLEMTHWQPSETPLVILAEGCFGDSHSKLALGVIRYGTWPIAAVIDSTRAGKTVRDVTGLPCDAPVVATLDEALCHQPQALLIGTAPAGGQLPKPWRNILKEAIRNRLHVINGLHVFLTHEPRMVTLARQYGVRLWDVRDPNAYGRHKFDVINLQKPRPKNVQVITMVGTDCNVGKMHSALELHRRACEQGHSSAFLATGQTGILVAGRGIPLDRVIGDFMAGGMELCIQEEITRLEATRPGAAHTVFVEGQGSLVHPAYAGVTMGLLHGSDPDAMILCHRADLEAVRNYPHLPLGDLRRFIGMYENAAAWVRPPDTPKARILGISVNTSMWPEKQAAAYLAQIAEETGMPATDPVRYGVDTLLSALSLENPTEPRSVAS